MDKVLIPRFGTPSFQKNVNDLEKKKRNSFLTIFPSTVHAAFQSFGVPAYIGLGFSTGHNLEKIAFFDDKWPAFYQGVFAGYLLADFTKTTTMVYMIHHSTAIAAWTLSAYLQSMQWQTALLQCCEFSTLFFNLRRFLLMAEYDKDGKLMAIVNLLFMVSFGLVRILPLPMIIRELFATGFAEMRDKDGLLMAVLGAGFTMIHTALQTTWFSMMVNKLVFVLLGGSKEKNKIE